MQCFAVYGNIEQKASAWTHSSQPAFPLLCLETLQHLGTPILLVTAGILRSHCHTWVSAPLCHQSTFRPEMKPTFTDFVKFWFCDLLLIILCSSLLKAGSLPTTTFLDLSAWIQVSATPTFQKVVTFLLAEFWHFFSQISVWPLRYSEWVDNYRAIFEGPNLGFPSPLTS